MLMNVYTKIEMKTIKILFFIDGLRLGGKERRLIELLKGLKKHPEFEIVVASFWKEICYKEFFKLNIPFILIEKKRKFDPAIFFKFYNLIQKIKPDVVHTWSSTNASYSIFAKIFSNFTLVNSQITDAPLKINWFSQFGIQTKLNFIFSDAILANSKAGLLSYNAPEYKSIVIYNGFDFSRLYNLKSPDIVRKKFKITTKHVVGMVASFSLLKDYENYIKAAQHILNKNDAITFLCVGAGDDGPYRQLVMPKFSTKIIFLGPRKNVESIMNICDIGVLATYTEGIANSIMEFMVLGKPVVATDGGGTKELIKDGKTGFLVKPMSSEELALKIEYLLNNREIRSTMGEKGRNRIKIEFSIEKMINSFVNCYRALPIQKVTP
jgi:glycosyltransferase involved in cell wall biosynthesis